MPFFLKKRFQRLFKLSRRKNNKKDNRKFILRKNIGGEERGQEFLDELEAWMKESFAGWKVRFDFALIQNCVKIKT